MTAAQGLALLWGLLVAWTLLHWLAFTAIPAWTARRKAHADAQVRAAIARERAGFAAHDAIRAALRAPVETGRLRRALPLPPDWPALARQALHDELSAIQAAGCACPYCAQAAAALQMGLAAAQAEPGRAFYVRQGWPV